MFKIDRRHALVAIAAAVWLLSPLPASAQSAQLTPEEQRNVQVVNDFIAAWNAKDGAKIMSFFAEGARFAVGPIGETQFVTPDFEGFVNGAQAVKMTVTPDTTWARGPVVTHERTDDITMANGSTAASGTYIAIFTLRDGKIVDFIDFIKP